jgi:hypothetical protein
MLAMRLPLRRLLLFTGAHAVVTLCLMLYAFSAGMAEFDDPDLPHSGTGRTAGTVAGVLLAPGRFVWPTKNLPNALEWVLFLANSVVWGVLLVGATALLQGQSRKVHRL